MCGSTWSRWQRRTGLSATAWLRTRRKDLECPLPPHGARMFKEGLLKGKRILITGGGTGLGREIAAKYVELGAELWICGRRGGVLQETAKDRKSTRLNSSHSQISYAVFCLKKKKKKTEHRTLL